MSTHRSRWRQLLAVMAGVAAATTAVPVFAAPTSVGVAKAWAPNQDDSLLFDVRLAQYRLGEGVRGYATPSGTCVDFADMIQTLDLPIRLDKKSRRATGWMFQEGRTLSIDRDANTVQIMNNKSDLAPETIRDTPEGWCVAVPVLARWLGLQISEDKNNAVLVLHSDTKLPLQNAMERKAKAAGIRPQMAFDLKTLPQAKVIYAGIKPPAIDVVASVGGRRDRQAGSAANINYEIYASGEVGKVAYDARIASDQRGVPSSLRVRAYRTDPNGGLLGRLHATHVEVGDVSGISTALVSQSSTGRGFMLTNRPIERPDSFSMTHFTGELPMGWDAELYRNNQLLAFSEGRADGRYDFQNVALLYGQNRFEIVLYGPQGQIKREQHLVTVGGNSIPPKDTYYWAGINENGHDLVNLSRQVLPGQGGWRGAFGLERGVNSKMSVALTFQSLTLAMGGRHYYLEEAIRRAIGPALFEVSESSELGDGGLALRASMLAQFGNTYVSLETINARDGYQSDRILPGVTGIHTATIDQSVKLGTTYFPIHLESRYTTTTSGLNTLDTSARLSANLGRWLMTGEVDYIKSASRNGPPLPDQIDAALLANVRIGGLRVRGEVRAEIAPTARLTTVSLVGEWLAGHDERTSAHWRAELGYDQSLSRGRAALGYVKQFKKIAVTATGEVATDGSVAAGLSLAFSLGGNGHGGMRITSAKQASSGSVRVRVFRDLNHNGVHDPGEPWEKGVLVTTGHIPVNDSTNADGEVIVDGLQPFIPLLVGIDTSTLADPLMHPETVGLVITPRPGVLQTIELAVATAGEVEGTLVKPGGGRLEGVDVELVDPAGVVIGHARSEYDGYLLFENVPYGNYTLRLAKLSADALRVSPSLNARAAVADQSPRVNLGTIAISK